MDSMERAILMAITESDNGITASKLREIIGTSRATLYRKLAELTVDYPIVSHREGKEAVYKLMETERTERVQQSIINQMLLQKGDFTFSLQEKLLVEMMFDNYSRIPSIADDVNKLKEKFDVFFSIAGHANPAKDSQKGFIKGLKHHIRRIDSFMDLPKNSDKGRMDIIFKLADAALKRKVCRIVYEAPNKAPRECDIRPLCIFLYRGGFYAIAETAKYDYSSKWAVERIKSLVETNETFISKSSVPTDHILSEPFGLPQEDQFEAKILIREKQVPYIMSVKWPSNRVTFSEKDENGDVVMTVITSGAYELVRWLRYQGTDVKLLSPDFLIKRLAQSCKELDEQTQLNEYY